MTDYSIIERIFYSIGSLIAIILGVTKLKRLSEPPNIKLRISNLWIDNKKKNKYDQDLLPLEYSIDVLNTGRDLVGELILKIGSTETYQLSGIINLRKNVPQKFEGVEEITPLGINIKEIETPFKAKIFFLDIGGKIHALHETTVGIQATGMSHTKYSI